MLPDVGLPFVGLPALRHERDIESFDGPILAQLRSDTGVIYLEKWCAHADRVTRTLVVKTTDRWVAEYLAGRAPMIALLTGNDGVGCVVDYRGGQRSRVRLVEVTALPENYLPKPWATHDPSLRPPWSMEPQTFLVDREWDARLLADLEKRYLEPYSFCVFFSAQADTPPPPPSRAVTDATYEHGYQYWSFFEQLRRRTPPTDRALSVAVAAASPGALTIGAPPHLAQRVNAAVVAAALPEAARAYHNVHTWSRLSRKELAKLPSSAGASYRALCTMLAIDADRLLAHVDETGGPALLAAGQRIAAHYRRLVRLRELPRGVELLTPTPRPDAAPRADADG